MQTSAFQFVKPLLVRMNFHAGSPADDKAEDSAGEIRFRVDIMRGENQPRAASVTLTVTIGQEGDPFFLEVAMASLFRWDETCDDRADSFLKQNAPSLLVSYIRPIVANITGASVHGAYDIPFLDFSQQ